MRRKTRRYAYLLLACFIAVSLGFISGYLMKPGEPAKPAAAPLNNNNNNNSNNKQNGTIQSESDPGSLNQGPDDKQPDPGPVVNYSAERPSLMSLTLSDTVDEVTKRYGKPTRQYVQNEEGESLIVYHYAQFAVGFAENRKIRFIEINPTAQDTGLNGLRLGANHKACLNALGDPDTDSGYVLTYRTESTILKLDMDPDSDTLQSVKLFNRQDA
jgi:hypothetical protein